MGSDIPQERPTEGISHTALNYLDIVGKVGTCVATAGTGLGAGFGWGAGAYFGMQSAVVTAGRAMPLAGVSEMAGEAAAFASIPGILTGVVSVDLLSLKTQIEFDQEHPDIALSVMQSTAGGPGL
jgi:hypothetical protein